MSTPDKAAEWLRTLLAREDRATLARLRRARTPMEALAIDGFMGLHRRLGAGERNIRLHAELACVLAHVRKLNGQSLAGALGHQEGGRGSPRRFSEQRFRRLLQIERADTGELTLALIRIVRLLRGEANPRDLAEAMLFWGDRLKTSWAYRYFGEYAADPSATDRQTEEIV
jgi:CRISPR type I-E-associated protein CasB/Cse2